MAKLSNQKCRSAGFLKIPCCAGLFLSLLEHMKATFGLKELESVSYQFFAGQAILALPSTNSGIQQATFMT